ncbi:MAG: DUF1232 domain-containing protein [Spirochaetia bacterium]|nr:DUF1232 domain-containing protein [Spirochaetia bacterium]
MIDSDNFQEEKKASEQELIETYQKHFDKNVALKLLVKLRKSTRNKPKLIAGTTGAIVTALGSLISALENPTTPNHMKALIIGAIGYIIFPLDLIPDITPLVGYTDDLASVASIVAGVAAYTNFSLEELDKYIDSLEKK